MPHSPLASADDTKQQYAAARFTKTLQATARAFLATTSDEARWIAAFHCFKSNLFSLKRNYAQNDMSLLENKK